MSVKENILSFVESKLTAMFTSAATVLSGISSAMAWIPEVLGYIATSIGIVLSLVMIYNQLRNGRADHDKTIAETKILNAKLATLEKEIKIGNSEKI